MVREIRVKEYRFSETISATTTGSYVSDQVINGEILNIDWAYGTGVGSIFLTNAGTSEEMFRRNAASGAGTQVARPRVAGQSTTGSIANASYDPFNINDKLVLNVAGVVSGTSPLTFNVRYR